MHPRVDYDAIADVYERRYLRNDYSGVEDAVTTFVGPDVQGRVLEVGCGTGHWLDVLGRTGVRVAGLDASMRMLAHSLSDPRHIVVQGRAEQLPYMSASFERLICVNALHHFQNKELFLAEARRVLRPGGRMMTIGLDPHTRMDRWYIYEYFEQSLEIDRLRYPASEQIREWMGASGFVGCATCEVQHSPGRLPARTALEDGRVDRAATSQLSVLSDEQYEQGIARMRKEIDCAEARGGALYLTADLRLYATYGVVPSE